MSALVDPSWRKPQVRSTLKWPERGPGFPTDRQLFAQAAARRQGLHRGSLVSAVTKLEDADDFRQERRLERHRDLDNESEFQYRFNPGRRLALVDTKPCTRAPSRATKKPPAIFTPAPDGLNNKTSALSQESHMQLAFDMLDRKRTGFLSEHHAMEWFRLMGWCVPDEELRQMLSSCRGHSIAYDTLAHLQKVNMERRNSGVDKLDSALRLLCGGERKLRHCQLVEITCASCGLSQEEVSSYLTILGFPNNAMPIDSREVAAKMCKHISQPSVTIPGFTPAAC